MGDFFNEELTKLRYSANSLSIINVRAQYYLVSIPDANSAITTIYLKQIDAARWFIFLYHREQIIEYFKYLLLNL